MPRMVNQAKALFHWYQKNKRDLLWRKYSSPYRIWVAEVMLQQTTVQSVTPYYKKFLKKFPTLKSLAQSSISEVLPYWAGLGYYNRARNLHKSAQIFFKKGFPKKAKELEKYPGFGPYTSKAVSSIAFGEFVNVVDGNVIRVFCRHENLKIKWWKNTQPIEEEARKWSKNLPIGDMNQAFMELGAVICAPKNPLCFKCPLKKTCKAKQLGLIDQLPLKKIQRKKEKILWKPQIIIKNSRIFLTKNHKAPFLKNTWLLPGSIQRIKNLPKVYKFKHSITHYDIFVDLKPQKNIKKMEGKWVLLQKVSSANPSSLLKKCLKYIEI